MSQPFEIDVKRFYLPGVVLKERCPSCGAEALDDLGDRYLSYPTANVDFDHGMWCKDCGHEWKVKLHLRLELRRVEASPAVAGTGSGRS